MALKILTRFQNPAVKISKNSTVWTSTVSNCCSCPWRCWQDSNAVHP